MGCWNATCLLSNLPICYGDPVVGVFTACIGDAFDYLSQSIGAHCDPSDIATPVGLPFRGSYNDYGSIEYVDSSSVVVDYILNALDATDLKSLLDDVSDREKCIEYPNIKKPVGINLVMFHEDIFNGIVDECEFNDDVDSDVRRSIEVANIVRNGEEIRGCIDSMNILGKYGFNATSYYSVFELLNILEQKCASVAEFDLEIKALTTAIVEQIKISAMLGILRRSWISGSGSGSQDISYDTHLKLNKLIKEQATKGFLKEEKKKYE